MSNLKDVLSGIKKSFSLTKKVEFAELGLTFELGTLTSQEEIKILEAIKDVSDVGYLDNLKKVSLAFGIKKINDFDLTETIEYTDETTGKKVTESKFLFLTKELDSWSTAIRDALFDAFSNLQAELEDKVSNGIKFERFSIQEKRTDLKRELSDVPKGYKKIEEPEEAKTEIEKLNDKVKSEVESAQAGLDSAASAAMDKIKN
jgi:hypothetical protein